MFNLTVAKLVGVALLCGVFSGVRGGLFTIAMTKLNVRIRKQLLLSLLQQDVGFYDITKTGEITSRLSADTTTVADSVSLNCNVIVRSATQAVIVLTFMFAACWRLTVVTFTIIPLVGTISKIYGTYYRKLSKGAQTAIADANGVADEALSTMTTIKAHAAQDSAFADYGDKLVHYYGILVKEALAYGLYACLNMFMPAAVGALVLYYGGNLVLNGDMSPGSLVSFMLYQQSLSSAFQMMADVFSSLTAAVGAADKVMELIERKPEVSSRTFNRCFHVTTHLLFGSCCFADVAVRLGPVHMSGSFTVGLRPVTCTSHEQSFVASIRM